jgi:hypothetical protein
VRRGGVDSDNFAEQSVAMDSASQSERLLIAHVDQLTERGWRMASPVWFPLLCTAVTVLASAPVALLLDRHDGAGLYWLVAAPLSALASAWFFTTRRAEPPPAVGTTVLVTGLLMLALTMTLAWLGGGNWSAVAPWVVVGIGFGVFAVAWRSTTTGAVSAACLLSAVLVGPVDVPYGDLVPVVVIGLTAALATFVELLRA